MVLDSVSNTCSTIIIVVGALTLVSCERNILMSLFSAYFFHSVCPSIAVHPPSLILNEWTTEQSDYICLSSDLVRDACLLFYLFRWIIQYNVYKCIVCGCVCICSFILYATVPSRGYIVMEIVLSFYSTASYSISRSR